jgi:uncharacterized protein (DUF488 family)
MALRIYTIGHSTRPITEFLEMLAAHGVRRLVDVRTVPRSGHNPQYGKQALSASLEARGIRYQHLPGLGGLRRPRPDSVNHGWRNSSFRGYADYMQTPEFLQSLEALIAVGANGPTAIMCAEAVPWRCHRSLIADALIVRGIEAVEIQSAIKTSPLTLHPFARVRGVEITYPSETAQGTLDLSADTDPVKATEEVRDGR